jgi:TATA-box binding protein (TBP) (component of TFIID and TFIIIB)
METNNYLKLEHFDDTKLSKNLNVSTISLTFHLNTHVNLTYINKYLELNINDICSVDYDGVYRTLRDKKKNKKKKSDNFYNSITLEISPSENKYINFKIFRNGGVQVAGCKNITEANIAINALIRRLSEKIGIKCEESDKLVDIEFIENPIEINKLKINLINVNFKIDYNINREIFYNILLSQSIECYYEKCKHAGVCIKFTPIDKVKPVSIFIFESGSIVITGSKNEKHIIESYNYIINLINQHKKKIQKPSSESMLDNVLQSKFGHLIIRN